VNHDGLSLRFGRDIILWLQIGNKMVWPDL